MHQSSKDNTGAIISSIFKAYVSYCICVRSHTMSTIGQLALICTYKQPRT